MAILLPGIVRASLAQNCVDSQSRCGNSRLESRVRENRPHGSEGGEGERPSLPLSFWDLFNVS
jgi:hypothetical protein